MPDSRPWAVSTVMEILSQYTHIISFIILFTLYGVFILKGDQIKEMIESITYVCWIS